MIKYNIITSQFAGKKILVVGDIMLDRHIIGSVSRISPEAPVPVVLEDQRVETIGGAANVANNLSALGAQVIQVGIVGDDMEGRILLQKLQERNISTGGIFIQERFKTVTKTRVIAQHQQVVRIDCEIFPAALDRDKISAFIREQIDGVDAVIISDYGKGLINPELVHVICRRTHKSHKIFSVDPKVEHFNYYRHATAITPNRREAENAIRNLKIQHNAGTKLNIRDDRLKTDADINQAGQELLKFLDLESLLITLGEHGMRLFERGKKPCHIPTHAQDVYDVTGAGDAVISVFTLALVAGASKQQAAELANYAAGIVVGKLGAVAISADELLAAAQRVVEPSAPEGK